MIEIPNMRLFTGIDLMRDRIPEDSILTFRHLLEKHKLDDQNFETADHWFDGIP